MSSGKHKKIFKLAIVAFIVMVVVYLAYNLHIFDKDAISEIVMSAEQEGAPIFIIICTGLLTFFVPLTWFIVISALFLSWKGHMYVIFSAFLGSIISFFIGKIFRKDVKNLLYKMNEKKPSKMDLDSMSKQIDMYGVNYICFIRSIPLTPYTLINYLSGISDVNFKDYVIGTIFGLLPSETINRLFIRSIASISSEPLNFIIWGGAKLLFTVFVIGFHRWFRKRR